MGFRRSENICTRQVLAWTTRLHVMSHVVNYGSSVLRDSLLCAASGPAIFRATEHMQRLIDSGAIYRSMSCFTRDQIVERSGRTGETPRRLACSIPADRAARPGESGVNPFNSPTESISANYPVGGISGTDASEA